MRGILVDINFDFYWGQIRENSFGRRTRRTDAELR
jgi:hypothetical protein